LLNQALFVRSDIDLYSLDNGESVACGTCRSHVANSESSESSESSGPLLRSISSTYFLPSNPKNIFLVQKKEGKKDSNGRPLLSLFSVFRYVSFSAAIVRSRMDNFVDA
jgi:hypothetical protein